MSEQILDLDDFLERVQDDKELLVELLDIFVTDYHEKRQALEEAFNNKDYRTIEHVAHFLKGSCGNISAAPLRAIFLELEQKGKDQNVDDPQKYLDEIDTKFEELAAYIGEIRTKLQ